MTYILLPLLPPYHYLWNIPLHFVVVPPYLLLITRVLLILLYLASLLYCSLGLAIACIYNTCLIDANHRTFSAMIWNTALSRTKHLVITDRACDTLDDPLELAGLLRNAIVLVFCTLVNVGDRVSDKS